MFDELQAKLTSALQRLAGRGVLTEDAVREGLREIRRILLEADVGFDLTRRFLERVEAKAVGQEVLKSVRPGQQLVKIVYDELVAMLGEKQAPIAHASVPPTVILLVGLQGSGKTTTAGKLARRLKLEQKAPFLVAADPYRPAAAEQLVTLAEQAGVGCYPGGGAGETDVVTLVKHAIDAAGKARARTVLVDTAGRLQIDPEMMAELVRLKSAVNPHEILLVADGMTGQDAVRIAQGFHDALGLTGVILTKMDGDARGGAALSIYGTTGAPIKYVGVGEQLDALEPFHPERMAARVLGMGDILSLVEEAHKQVDLEQAQRVAEKLKKGKGFDLEDFKQQLLQMQKMGGMASMLDKLPAQLAGSINPAQLQDDRQLRRTAGVINAMTPQERAHPELIKASRKRRIAAGAGVPVQEVNRLLNQFEQMQKMMKMMKGGNMARMMRNLKGALPGLR